MGRGKRKLAMLQSSPQAGAILCFLFGNHRALISLTKNHSLIFTRSLVSLVERNDCSLSCPLLPVWCEGILFPGWEIKVEVSAPNLQLAISRVLSTALRQIIFIVSLLLPGAAAMKKQFGETVIVSPIDWTRRGPGTGAAGEAGALRLRCRTAPCFPCRGHPRGGRGKSWGKRLQTPGSGRDSPSGSARARWQQRGRLPEGVPAEASLAKLLRAEHSAIVACAAKMDGCIFTYLLNSY